MRGNGFRKSFCTKGSQKQNQKLARPSLNRGLAALSWPGCSLCVLLGLIAVGLYSCYGTALANSCAQLLAHLSRPAPTRNFSRSGERGVFQGPIV